MRVRVRVRRVLNIVSVFDPCRVANIVTEGADTPKRKTASVRG